MSSDCQNSEFIFVKSKRKSRKIDRKSLQKTCEVDVSTPSFDAERLLSKIIESQIDLESADYYINFVSQLKSSLNKVGGGPIDHLICLGLGHFSDCTISRYQLALALLVQDKFKIRFLQFYDPIFTKDEQDLLIRLKCEVLSENLEGKYPVVSGGCTVFYLPHCPKQISNNILWRNWDKHSLEQTILIGNSFSNILTATPLRLLEKTAGYIVRIEKYTTEIPLKNNFRYTDIFNDTSIHIFESSKLATLTESNWLDADEPKYADEDSELVANTFDNLKIE